MEAVHGLLLKRSKSAAIMSLIIAVFAMFSSLAGLFVDSIYSDVLSTGTITQNLLKGSLAQDIVSVPLALLLFVLIVIFLKRSSYKIFIFIMGLTGYFLYAYALYVIQGNYTSIYLVYLLIFSLSIFSLVFGLLSFTSELTENTSMPKPLRIAISVFLFSIVLILGLVWILRITPDISRHIPNDAYAVFILDLGIVFPSILFTGVMLLQGKSFGNILAGVFLLKAITVCLSWGFGEMYVRAFKNLQEDVGMLVIPTVLTIISCVLFGLYLKKLKYTVPH